MNLNFGALLIEFLTIKYADYKIKSVIETAKPEICIKKISNLTKLNLFLFPIPDPMNNKQELEKVTDFVEDKGIDEKHLNTALSDITGKAKKTEEVQYKINEKDLEFLMREFLLEKPKALKSLRQSKGDLKTAIKQIIES